MSPSPSERPLESKLKCRPTLTMHAAYCGNIDGVMFDSHSIASGFVSGLLVNALIQRIATAFGCRL